VDFPAFTRQSGKSKAYQIAGYQFSEAERIVRQLQQTAAGGLIVSLKWLDQVSDLAGLLKSNSLIRHLMLMFQMKKSSSATLIKNQLPEQLVFCFTR